MRSGRLGGWALGGAVMLGLGCASPPEGEAPASEPAAASAAAQGSPIEGCGGGLRLLPDSRVLVAGRTVDCGELDQLLREGVIEHGCLGALSKQGGRACIERFVEQSRGRATLRPPAAPAPFPAPSTTPPPSPSPTPAPTAAP